MKSKQEERAEKTKANILNAAGKLFAEKGYVAVTIREIAREAGCSHTAIYLYFKDKETLLHELSMPSLLALQEKLDGITCESDLTIEEKMKRVSLEFIRFCLHNQSMYFIFLGANASRVDDKAPKLEINKVRIGLFQILTKLLQAYLDINDEELLLMYSRIFFYTLHGCIATYTPLDETLDELMARLTTTFEEAVEVLLIGFRKKVRQGEGIK